MTWHESLSDSYVAGPNSVPGQRRHRQTVPYERSNRGEVTWYLHRSAPGGRRRQETVVPYWGHVNEFKWKALLPLFSRPMARE